MAVNSIPVQSLENLRSVQEDLIPELSSNVGESQLSGELIQELNSNLEISEIPSIDTLEELEAQIQPAKPLQTLKANSLSLGSFQKLQAESLSGETLEVVSPEFDLLAPVTQIFEGTVGRDFIVGTNNADAIFARGGNDIVFALNGDDRTFGEEGNDLLIGGGGSDFLDGGSDNDLIFGDYVSSSVGGDDDLVAGDGYDTVFGGSGNDRLIGVGVDPSIEKLGLGEVDRLTGNGGSDTFVLGADPQVYYVGGGNSDYAHITGFNLSEDVIELPANPGSVNAPISVTEIGEAGQLLPDAQVIPGGSATLDSISGTLFSNNDVDLFKITLTGGGTFSATTIGGAGFDTELFLFDANGIGVYGNDDVAQGIEQSTLPAGSPLTPQQPGTYFLAITGFQNEPESSGGRIFELTDDGSGLLEPTNSGGELPLSGFTGEGDKSGSYTIELTGVESAPFSLGASPTGLPDGTGISFENDLIAIIEGVSPSALSLGSANFVFA